MILKEERRVLYVALTRAQNELILTKQNFNLWARDTVDEQGRKLDSYFLNDLTRQLCAMETSSPYPSANCEKCLGGTPSD